MKTIVMVVLAAAVIGAAIYLVAAPSGEGQNMGQGVPAGAAVTPIGELTAKPEAYAGKEVVVQGTLAEECPTSGCWGVVNDGTGTIRFDTSAQGWAMPLGKAGARITVRGTVIRNESGAPEISAVGARW